MVLGRDFEGEERVNEETTDRGPHRPDILRKWSQVGGCIWNYAMNRRTLNALGSQSRVGILIDPLVIKADVKVEVLELGLLNEQIWDRKGEIPGKENWRSKVMQPGL